MQLERALALRYLRSPANAVWRWSDRGSTVAWSDGSTVAFREEIAEILDTFEPWGLPPFDSLVLLLAACKGKLVEPDLILHLNHPEAAANTERKQFLLKLLEGQFGLGIALSLKQLNALGNLPRELVGTTRGKAVLARAVFEDEDENAPPSGPILRAILEPFSDSELNEDRKNFISANDLLGLRRLSAGLQRHTAESLILRLRTGLDALPKPVEVELPCAERVRRLLQELGRDKEYAGMARVARELMAAIRLPQRLVEEDFLPVGGVADISNRGPLDHLLLSELAHDDLTLVMRVALGEALYLRREPPAREPPKTLAILLDSGMRLWGVPRVFATAVALALVAREACLREVTVWRASRQELVPTDLLTRDGLIRHLCALDTHAHPGAALRAFAEALPKASPAQSVLITARAALADPEFVQTLIAARPAPDFLAVVDRDGRFELHAWPASFRHPISSATLDLADLFQESKSAASLVDPAWATRLPLAFGVRPFPLRLPVQGPIDLAMALEVGGICVTADHRLLSWSSPGQGALQLTGGLPGTRTLWLHPGTDGQSSLVRLDEPHQRQLLIRVGKEGRHTVHCLSQSTAATHFFQYGTVLLAIAPTRVTAVSLTTGAVLAVAENIPGTTHHGGRFWRRDDRWWCAVWNGQDIAWDPVTLAAPVLGQDVLLLFDCERRGEPLVLTRTGALFTTTGAVVLDSGRPLLSAECSPDGASVLGTLSAEQGAVLFDLTGWRCELRPHSAALPRIEETLQFPTHDLRQDIEAISINHAGYNAGCMTLYAGANEGLRLVYDDRGRPHLEPFRVQGPVPSGVLRFQPVDTPPSLGCQLQMVQWANGNRAFLDSRGLLHLVSHNPSVHDLCLALTPGLLTGWASDGFFFGSKFFGDSRESVTRWEVRYWLAKFFRATW